MLEIELVANHLAAFRPDVAVGIIAAIVIAYVVGAHKQRLGI